MNQSTNEALPMGTYSTILAAYMMRDGRVICPHCYMTAGPEIEPEFHYKLYHINLAQYNQHCHACGDLIHQGTFKCELFEKPSTEPEPESTDDLADRTNFYNFVLTIPVGHEESVEMVEEALQEGLESADLLCFDCAADQITDEPILTELREQYRDLLLG